MKKYVCSICGYVYDETVGDPEKGIAPGKRWEDVPEDWVCPLCGADKAEFKRQDGKPDVQDAEALDDDTREMHELSFGELSALCSNLSKGCEKQYRAGEAELFNQLAQYYKSKAKPVEDGSIQKLISLIQHDLNTGYAAAGKKAADNADRGALRALTWGEKVTKILSSLLSRYDKQQDDLLKNTRVYVCEICGFIYIGGEAPEICPVCKVPNKKIIEVKRG
jgi:rubredoxin